MSYIDLDIEATGIDRTIAELNATEKQVQRALRSTLSKMASWMRTRSVRGLSAHLEIQQKIIRRRLRTFKLKRTADGHSITVWYGLDPVSLIYVGARQTRQGVTAGKHRRPGAFIRNSKSGSAQVFKRRGSARLPLEKQRLAVQDKTQAFLEDNVIGDVEFEAQFFKVFEHELQWRTRT